MYIYIYVSIYLCQCLCLNLQLSTVRRGCQHHLATSNMFSLQAWYRGGSSLILALLFEPRSCSSCDMWAQADPAGAEARELSFRWKKSVHLFKRYTKPTGYPTIDHFFIFFSMWSICSSTIFVHQFGEKLEEQTPGRIHWATARWDEGVEFLRLVSRVDLMKKFPILVLVIVLVLLVLVVVVVVVVVVVGYPVEFRILAFCFQESDPLMGVQVARKVDGKVGNSYFGRQVLTQKCFFRSSQSWHIKTKQNLWRLDDSLKSCETVAN